MKHTYNIQGMSCNGCKKHVTDALTNVNGVDKVTVNLGKATATIEMSLHIKLETFQEALNTLKGNYTICSQREEKHHHKVNILKGKGTGVYYCPMNCEGDKTYNEQVNCPVCGMDLVEEASSNQNKIQFTCSMHPQIIRDESGSCPICGMDLEPFKADDLAEEKIYKKLVTKFWIAIIFTLPIFLIAMSEMLNNNLLYNVLEQKYWNWIQFGLSIPVVFYATWMFFKRAWVSIKTVNLNMFTLIGIGAGITWVFSVFALLFPAIFPEDFKTPQGNVFVYFEAATVILTLVLLGELLQAKAHNQTNGAIKELLKLVPSVATLVINGKDKIIAIDKIKQGDLLRVKPGEKIPVDGIIIQGNSSINESMITGEPIPVYKTEKSAVSSGTINGTKSFIMKAEKVGSETLLSQIIEMVNKASRSKAPIQKIVDKVATYFVPIILIVSIITFGIWIILGPKPAYVFAFVNAISVLIIACPCALGLATPMSIMVGMGKGAQSGVLIKNAEALEKMNEVNTLIIDKTGTITQGKPSVEKMIVLTGQDENSVLEKIASLNQYSEHPLAEAIVAYGKSKKKTFFNVDNFEAIAGKGITGVINNHQIALGNNKLAKQLLILIPKAVQEKVFLEQVKGKTVSYIMIDKKVVGYIIIYDALKSSSKKTIQQLQNNGIEVIMLTGDNENTAKSIAKKLNITRYKAECLPKDKLNEIKALQKQGKIVAMAGDGINDAPALAQANVGIAMGTGTGVAIESASITLVKGDLQGIIKAKKLSFFVVKNIKQNLFFAFFYNISGVPIAGGILYPVFGILLSPMIAALAMSFSSVSVIINALRLRKITLK